MARTDKTRTTNAPSSVVINDDQAQFGALISDAARQDSTSSGDLPEGAVTPTEPPKPTVGRVVHYHSKHGDGIVSPAVVLRTRESTNLDVIERWGAKPDGTASGVSRPKDLVAELPDDDTVDLLVHGLGGDYREYCVPLRTVPATEVGTHDPAAGTWSWPPRT